MIVKSDIQIVISLGEIFANLGNHNGIHLLSGTLNISSFVGDFIYEIKEGHVNNNMQNGFITKFCKATKILSRCKVRYYC